MNPAPSLTLLFEVDDADLRGSLMDYLARYRIAAGSAEAADLMLGAATGADVTARVVRWRALHALPLVVLVSGADPLDRVLALHAGADDCLGLPFDPRELVARLQSVRRRATATAAAGTDGARRTWRFGAWTFDPIARRLIDADGQQQALSDAEARLLAALVRMPRRVRRREDLMQDSFGQPLTDGDRRVDLLISRLRQRLGADGTAWIRTVRSAGYVFDGPARTS